VERIVSKKFLKISIASHRASREPNLCLRGANDPAQKELQNSFGYSWPDQRREHLGRAIDGIRTDRLTGLPAGEAALQYMPGKMRAVLS
jgi:hypothetical protein